MTITIVLAVLISISSRIHVFVINHARDQDILHNQNTVKVHDVAKKTEHKIHTS